jgi:UDP-3-O-[3-hydroxymyristoyl] glucosamine N-acyltransferase
VAGIKVIGTDDDLADILKGGISKAAFAIGGVSLDTNIERMRKYKKIEDEGFEIISVIQKDSYVSRTATLGAGNIIVGNCYIGPGVKLGSGVIMHPFTSVEHDSIIGDYVQLSQGVKIAGSAKIGKASFIGMGASIIQGAIMPEETFVKSGSIYR